MLFFDDALLFVCVARALSRLSFQKKDKKALEFKVLQNPKLKDVREGM